MSSDQPSSAAATSPPRAVVIELPGSPGGTLAATLGLLDGEPRAFAVFAHCFPGADESSAAAAITASLMSRGIAVLALDVTVRDGSHRGVPRADAVSTADDIARLAEFLGESYAAPSILIGHSLGGAAVIAAAGRIPSARAVVTIAAPFGPDGILDAAQQERIRDLTAALLVMHSPTDSIVGVDSARRILESARHPTSFIALDGADQALTDMADAAFAADILATWAARYLGADETAQADATARADATAQPETPPQPGASAQPETTPPSGEPGLVIVAENANKPYGQDVRAGNHALLADEPEGFGHDTGPSPYEYLLSGLGACTSMTLRMYAERKGWPLEKVTVELRHAKVNAADCADCVTTSGKVDEIQCVISLEGELSDEQRERLLAIAGKCPVHRSLASEIKIRTSLA